MANVSSCLESIRHTLRFRLIDQSFTVVGDTINCNNKNNNSYITFDLIEKTATDNPCIRIFVPYQIVKKTEHTIRNNQTIEVTGKLGIYKNIIQIIAESINFISNVQKVQPVVIKIHRTPLPKIIEELAVISSESSQGYGDFLANLKYGRIKLFNNKMQGPTLPKEFAETIDKINNLNTFDCICIIRGGGNTYDLEEYNSPQLAESIQNSNIPILTAIGHHTDRFLCDQVADNPEFFSTPTSLAIYLNNYHDQYKRELNSRLQQPLSLEEKLSNFPYAKFIITLLIVYLIYQCFIK